MAGWSVERRLALRERTELERVREAKRQWDLQNPNEQAEQFIAHALLSGSALRRALVWYVCRRLSEPFVWEEFHAHRVRRHTYMIDEYRARNMEGVAKAQRFIGGVRLVRMSGIVTTNYDMLVEYALGSRGFNYGVRGEVLCGRGPYPVSQFYKPVTLTGETRLAKIHGSVFWNGSEHYTDGRRGLTGGALIVAPTPEKAPLAALASVWNMAGQVLRDTTHLLVFGFAFNPYDEAVLDLLRTNGTSIQSVLVVDIAPRVAEAQAIWPHAQVTVCHAPPDDAEQVSSWLNAAGAWQAAHT